VRFDQTAQSRTGATACRSSPTNAIYAVEWQVAHSDSDFDIWIDNTELVGCE